MAVSFRFCFFATGWILHVPSPQADSGSEGDARASHLLRITGAALATPSELCFVGVLSAFADTNMRKMRGMTKNLVESNYLINSILEIMVSYTTQVGILRNLEKIMQSYSLIYINIPIF